ncbi:MAG: Lrp/AsnC family transcriptional regulator [Candidatus Thorarchaeota archaeon]
MLDEKDRKILRELERDCRQRTNAIAKATNIPVTTVHNRIKKLSDSGHIHSFRAVLDPEKLDKPLVSFVFVSLNRNSLGNTESKTDREMIARIAAHPAIQEVHTVTGDWDLLLKIRAKDIGELEGIITSELREPKLIERAQTICAMATYKETSNLLYNGVG